MVRKGGGAGAGERRGEERSQTGTLARYVQWIEYNTIQYIHGNKAMEARTQVTSTVGRYVMVVIGR